jgi:endonuclease G
MKKILIALNIVIWTIVGAEFNNAYAWTQRQPFPVQSCQAHSPYGFPQANGLEAICQQAYLVGYDAQAKIPKFVTYTLLPPNAIGCVARTNAFVANQFIPNGPRPEDYAGTGFDKGHMAPDGDLSWDQQVEYESFLMTNMTPQQGSLNRGIWKLLETSIRGWSSQLNNSFTIYVGSVYDEKDKKIGNGVVVPHGFYKIVINNNTGEVAGWYFPHTPPYPNLGNDLTKFRVPLAQIQQVAGIQFKYPANARELNPGQEWPVDFGLLTNSKRAKCGKSSD